jgi:hypothetical protein
LWKRRCQHDRGVVREVSAARDFNPTRFIAGFQRIFTAAAELMFALVLTCRAEVCSKAKRTLIGIVETL